MEWLSSPDAWIGLLTLVVLEVVLGIDNVIFITILAGKLPAEQQARARQIGLGLALGTRILLLLTLSWIIGLTQPIFTVMGLAISGRDIILIAGGLFLIAKATYEIHHRLEGESGHASASAAPVFAGVILQIVLLDIVFSLDSVITAVGMVDEIAVMIIAVVIAIGIMLLSAGAIGNFVNRHPSVKMLALSFLLLIGFMLLLDGIHLHVPKEYVYFAMGFAIFVELLNLRAGRKVAEPPVLLHQPYTPTEPGAAAGA